MAFVCACCCTHKGCCTAAQLPGTQIISRPQMHPETHAQALAEGAAGMDQLQLGACLMMDSWVGSVSLPLAWPKYMKFSTLRAVRWMRVSFFPGQAPLSKLICTKGDTVCERERQRVGCASKELV